MQDKSWVEAGAGERLLRVRAIALDRDGTINVDVGYPHRVDDLQVIDGFLEFMRWAAFTRLPVSVITNQSGVARGYFTVADMQRFNEAINATIAQDGMKVESFECCPHLPEAGCNCRKPRTGMLERLSTRYEIPAAEWIVFGDQPTDIACARNFGALAVGVGSRFFGTNPVGTSPDFVVRTLGEFPELYRRVTETGSRT